MSPSQLFKQASLEAVDYMKLDCQGCEWPVTKLMMEDGLFDKVKVLASETHCETAELSTMDCAALMERKRAYDALKARSGRALEDSCGPVEDAKMEGRISQTFDLPTEVSRKCGDGHALRGSAANSSLSWLVRAALFAAVLRCSSCE